MEDSFRLSRWTLRVVIAVALLIVGWAVRVRLGLGALVLACTLTLGGCVDAIILGAIWWDCGIMATSFSECRSLKRSPDPSTYERPAPSGATPQSAVRWDTTPDGRVCYHSSTECDLLPCCPKPAAKVLYYLACPRVGEWTAEEKWPEDCLPLKARLGVQ